MSKCGMSADWFIMRRLWVDSLSTNQQTKVEEA
jgi:hypothetical protein